MQNVLAGWRGEGDEGKGPPPGTEQALQPDRQAENSLPRLSAAISRGATMQRIATPRRHVAIIIGLAVATLAPMRARADRDIADHDIAVPDVPANLEVPAGNHAYLR